MSILTRLSASSYDGSGFAGFVAQRDFTLANAKTMMWLSQLAYETDDQAKITATLGRWGLQLPPGGVISTPAVSTLPIARAQALVALGAGVALVAFGGTDPLVATDWVADFNIAPHGTTTQGFAQAAATALPAVRQLLAGGAAPILVAGHSLGGALAALAALDLAKAGLPVAAVYTFGMPRPGGADFRTDYDGRLGDVTYRLVLGDDVVSTVAPSALGFRHVGRLLHQPRGTAFDAANLTPSPGSDDPLFGAPGVDALRQDWEAALDGLGIGPGVGPHAPTWSGRPRGVSLLLQALPRGIQDHLPDSYIAALT